MKCVLKGLHSDVNVRCLEFFDQALDFVQQTVSVYTVSWLWTHLARASRQHWENLAAHDPARSDERTFVHAESLEAARHVARIVLRLLLGRGARRAVGGPVGGERRDGGASVGCAAGICPLHAHSWVGG